MKKPQTFTPLLALLVFSISCATPEAAGTLYGEELTLTQTTSIADILADPEAYVGQRLLIAGTVVDVCEMRGCWLELAGEEDFGKLRVKVDDGVIVFPMSARGLHARVEGVFEKLEYSEEEAVEMAQHQAEEHGTEFDPSVVTGPEVVYQLKGIGAIIEEQSQ
jgi:hypothetical protein